MKIKAFGMAGALVFSHFTIQAQAVKISTGEGEIELAQAGAEAEFV